MDPWKDQQYLKIYHPTTTTSSFSIAPVHKEAFKAGAVGVMTGAMVGAATCPISTLPVYASCVATRSAATGLAAMNGVYAYSALKK